MKITLIVLALAVCAHAEAAEKLTQREKDLIEYGKYVRDNELANQSSTGAAGKGLYKILSADCFADCLKDDPDDALYCKNLCD